MLVEPKILYMCNHLVDELIKTPVSCEVIRSAGTLIDTVPNATNIFEAISLYQLNDVGGIWYFEGIDYKIKSPVSIQWLEGANAPSDGETYIFEYINMEKNFGQFSNEDCPKCGGNGWFISILNETGLTVKKASGSYKLIQGFVKLLFTEKDEGGYGSDIHQLSSQPLYRKDDFTAEIMRIVYECELQFKQLQLSRANFSDKITTDEKLRSATVVDTFYDSAAQGFYATIVLKGESGNTASLSIGV